MKTDMYMNVIPSVFPGRLEPAQAKEIVADELIEAVDGVADIALYNITVEHAHVIRPASRTSEPRREQVHIEAVRMPLKQFSWAWACFYF